MITIISGTNRKESSTSIFAKHCYEYIKSVTEEKVCLIDLIDVSADIYNENMYSSDGQSEGSRILQDEKLIPSTKFLFIFPEYNGSYPGALKVFIDACSIRQLKETWSGKKAGLIGIASGRAGNLRGLDQFATVLNHLGTSTLPNKLPISQINSLIEGGEVKNAGTIDVMSKLCDSLLDM